MSLFTENVIAVSARDLFLALTMDAERGRHRTPHWCVACDIDTRRFQLELASITGEPTDPKHRLLAQVTQP